MFDLVNKLHKSTYDNYNIIGIKETLINNYYIGFSCNYLITNNNNNNIIIIIIY
jgi:hypothetical protein